MWNSKYPIKWYIKEVITCYTDCYESKTGDKRENNWHALREGGQPSLDCTCEDGCWGNMIFKPIKKIVEANNKHALYILISLYCDD